MCTSGSQQGEAWWQIDVDAKDESKAHTIKYSVYFLQFATGSDIFSRNSFPVANSSINYQDNINNAISSMKMHIHLSPN